LCHDPLRLSLCSRDLYSLQTNYKNTPKKKKKKQHTVFSFFFWSLFLPSLPPPLLSSLPPPPNHLQKEGRWGRKQGAPPKKNKTALRLHEGTGRTLGEKEDQDQKSNKTTLEARGEGRPTTRSLRRRRLRDKTKQTKQTNNKEKQKKRTHRKRSAGNPEKDSRLA
jgi:hypothetical protein